MPIIEFEHVTKEFGLGQLQTFRQTALHAVHRMRGVPVERPEPFRALNDINLSIEEGEVLGIIGHNGAGKSTLLKLLANISRPTSGRVTVRGRVAPLIEVGAGLVGDLTGRENIYLNGAILGMRRHQIDGKFDEIVEFAELEQFIDTPIKRYSSGMQIRLGFSIATCVDAEILIVDEVLAVGDLAFQRKCFDRMEDLIKRQGRTVLIVSHNLRQIERLCARALRLDHGRVANDGAASEVCNAFIDQSNEKIKSQVAATGLRSLTITDDLAFERLELIDEQNRVVDRVPFMRPCRVRLYFEARRPLCGMSFLVSIHTTDFVYLTGNSTIPQVVDLEPGPHVIELQFECMRLLTGAYSFRVWIGTAEGKTSFDAENLTTFQVTTTGGLTEQHHHGVVYMEGSWDMSDVSVKKPSLEEKIRA